MVIIRQSIHQIYYSFVVVLREIAHIAMKKKTGARGLQAIVEDIMLDVMYERPCVEDGISKVIITKNTVYTKEAWLVEAA